MKKFILPIIVLSLIWVANKAFSKDLAFLNNQGGGKIIITDELCVSGNKTYPGIFRIYNYNYTGRSTEGCYRVNGENIMVVWAGETQYYYYPINRLNFYGK